MKITDFTIALVLLISCLSHTEGPMLGHAVCRQHELTSGQEAVVGHPRVALVLYLRVK